MRTGMKVTTLTFHLYLRHTPQMQFLFLLTSCMEINKNHGVHFRQRDVDNNRTTKVSKELMNAGVTTEVAHYFLSSTLTPSWLP